LQLQCFTISPCLVHYTVNIIFWVLKSSGVCLWGNEKGTIYFCLQSKARPFALMFLLNETIWQESLAINHDALIIINLHYFLMHEGLYFDGMHSHQILPPPYQIKLWMVHYNGTLLLYCTYHLLIEHHAPTTVYIYDPVRDPSIMPE